MTKTRAVRSDRWDEADFESAQSSVSKLTEAMQELGALSPAAAELVPDTFTSVVKIAPKLEDRAQMDPSRLKNHTVMGELMKADSWRDLRECTVDDPLSAAMASVTLASHLKDAFEKLPDISEHEEKAADARRALDELLEGAGAEPDGDTQAMIDRLTAEADAAVEELEQAIGDGEAVIGRAVRQGAAEALEEAEENAELASGWGMNPGQAARMDPTERLRLAARMNTPQMRRIAELLGALKNLTIGLRQNKHSIVPDEVQDVTLAGDLARLLPFDAIGLVAPELEMDFLLRFVNQRVLCFDVHGTEKEGRGGIVYLEDSSGSMAGDEMILSKAVGLTLLSIAKDEGRNFHAVCFGGPGELHEFAFSAPEHFTTEAMLDYAEFFLSSGGTDFVSPLDRARELLEAEHAATGKASADIVFATDGHAGVDNAWIVDFKHAQEQVGWNVYGIGIGTHAGAQPFTAICDGRVATVADLFSGGEVRDLFAAVV